MKKNKIILSLLSIALIFNATIQARYKSKHLNQIKKTNKNKATQTLVQETTEYVSFQYKAFTAKDCKKYFNSKKLIKNGYRPIQITLTNHSNSSFIITADSFNLPLICAADVALTLHRDGMSRGLGFAIGSLFIPILIIPAIVQGLGANCYNESMDKDFAEKALEDMVVAPNQTINGVIFVKSYRSIKDFVFNITNTTTNQTFKLSCKQPQVTIV